MAGIQAGTAYIPVKADMSKFGTDVKQGTKSAEGSIKGFAKKAGLMLGGAFAASKAKEFFGTAIAGAREAIEIDNQTEAVVKSTGGAAGITAVHVEKLSNKLQKQQTISDEVVQSGANLLLTFKNLRNEAGAGNDVFDRTTALAGDMSVAMGQDMKSSSILLGKALNDPKAGLSALTRVGVTFTEQQKEQISAMTESGDTLGAQKIILEEVESQFGGSAAAQADAGKKMSLAWSDFQEVIGRAVLPLLDKLIGGLTKLTRWAADNPGKTKAVAAVIGGALVLAFTAWAISAASAAAATIAAAAPVIAIGAAIAALAAGLIYAYNNWDAFRNVVDAVASFLTETVWPAIQAGAAWFMDTLVPAIGDVISWFGKLITKGAELAAKIAEAVGKIIGKFGEIVTKIISVAGDVGTKVGDIVGFVTGIPGRIASTVSTLWDGITSGITAAKNWVRDRIDDVVGFVSGLKARITAAASGMWNGITSAFKAAINTLIRGWNGLEFKIPGFKIGPVGYDGFTLGVPDIPTLHSGGVYRAPPGQREGLALLLDGERVLSPGQTRAGDRAGAQSDETYSIVVNYPPNVPTEEAIRLERQRARMLRAM